MAKYIKSYSNYVLKTKHQNTNDGVIYERDMTTIGGLNQFAKGQTPIYKSGNFIITVNDDVNTSRNMNNGGWLPNGDTDVWTLETTEQMTSGLTSDSSTQIVLKQNYYKLKDFAYFGSCSELIRASIGDILAKFPGELYAPFFEHTMNDGTKVNDGIAVFYENKTVIPSAIERLGNDKLFLVDNPFNINLHEINPFAQDDLKYLRNNNNYQNYEIIQNNKSFDIDSFNFAEIKKEPKCIGDHIGTIRITYNLNQHITLYAYIGTNYKVFYLAEAAVFGIHIRPKQKFINDYYESLDCFEQVLLRQDTTPKYSVDLEVISENSFGYVKELKTFTFPTTYGDYNLAINDNRLSMYMGSLSQYAEFYDERFCDNIWRSMTHEAIKNFDWTFTREFSDGEEEEYVIGGTKMQKFLRLCGRELDEIRMYIDGIKNANIVSYGKDNTIPDYFLSDAVENEGWVVTAINPFDDKLDRMTDSIIMPYKTANARYAWMCDCDKKTVHKTDITVNKNYVLDECANQFRRVIKFYTDEKSYTFDEINNHFLKLLKLNSKHIMKQKGTIASIESLLSLFGMKSKRWCKKYYNINEDDNNSQENDSNDNIDWDYDIKEYVIDNIKPIEDKWVDDYNMCKYDWINFTKTITYNTEDSKRGIYHSYQGLPCKAYIKYLRKTYSLDNLPIGNDGYTISINGLTRTLYPYFPKNSIIDGSPYYQMNGGWLYKSHYFDNANQMVTDNPMFTQTYRDIRSVETLENLIEIPYLQLKDGDIVFVKDLSGEYILIDGLMYDIQTDIEGNNYIVTYVYEGTISLGETNFENTVNLPSSIYDGKLQMQQYDLNSLEDGTELRIYLDKDYKLTVYGQYSTINNYAVFSNGKFITTQNVEESKPTHYFQLKNKDYKHEISTRGWMQLDENNVDYKYIDSIQDNFQGNNPHIGHSRYDKGYEYVTYFNQLFKYAIEKQEFDPRCYPSPDEFNKIMEEIKNIGFQIPQENTEPCSYQITENKKIHWLEQNEISETVMNTKRVDIIFNNKRETNFIIKFLDGVIMQYLEQLLPSNIICQVKYTI